MGETVYDYDQLGRLTQKTTPNKTIQLTYDYDNRLTDVTIVGSGLVSACYKYDPFGKRTQKTTNGKTTNYCYDGDDIIAEYDDQDTLTAKYVYGTADGELIQKEIAGAGLAPARYYYTHDGQGSVSEVTDSLGKVKEKYDYGAFGETTIRNTQDAILTTTSIGNEHQYKGARLEPETNLYSTSDGSTCYDTKTGRAVSVKPAPALGTQASNNPIIVGEGVERYASTAGVQVLMATLTVHADDRFSEGTITGHGAVTVTNDDGRSETWGNYPWRPRDDSKRKFDTSHTWDITQEQADAAMDAITQPGYNFFSDNCIDRTEDAMDASNIEHPSFNTFGVSDPHKLKPWLDEQNRKDQKKGGNK